MKELFSEFNPVSKKSWQEKIVSDLNGPIERLIKSNAAGLNVKPFYNSEDQKENQSSFQHQNLNVEDPVFGPNKWLNNQRIVVGSDIKSANALALEALTGGADSVTFSLPTGFQDFNKLFSEIKLEYCFHIVEIKDQSTLSSYISFIESFQGEELKCAIDLNLVSNYFKKGTFDLDQINFAKAQLAINSDYLVEAGASILEEGAVILSFINHLIESIATSIKSGLLIRLNIGSDLFLEIAKFRAMRWLINKILELWGVQIDIQIEGHSTIWNKTVYDPFVNMLRQTNESFAAVCGGVDILTSGQYLAAKGNQSALAFRQARNISHLLKYESHLDKVADPGAGSYYIESLTESYASAVWKMFQEIEAGGGLKKYNKTHNLISRFQRNKIKIQEEVSSGKKDVLGTNSFPNPKDKLTFDDLVNITSERLSFPFEKHRMQIDNYCIENGEISRPTALLIKIGSSPMRYARSTFVLNFLESAGIKCIEAEEGESHEGDAHYLVLCGSDEDYLKLNANIVADYKTEYNIDHLLIAGDPENKDQLKKDGIQSFIHRKSHLGNTLTELLKTFDFE